MDTDRKKGTSYEAKEYPLDEERRGSLVPDDSGAVHGEVLVAGSTVYAKIQRFVSGYGIEARGIERVPEDERTDRSTFKVGTMWCACNMVVSSFAIGALAVPVFGLGFVDALLTIFFVNLVGVLPVCFFSTFGPVFGMRQMILSRFWFGYYGVKLIAILNALACLGWSATNSIVGAQLIHQVNPNVPGYAGVIIIGAGTFIVTLFGYEVVHYYEMVSWIPSFIIYLIVLGEFAVSGAFSDIPMGVGRSEAAAVLSFAASVFGFSAAWASLASDYTCYQPRNASRPRIFMWVFIGLMFPLCFCEMLGLAIGTATLYHQDYNAAYTNGSVGGLLAQVLFHPLGGFGKFCLIVLALGTVGNNCPNVYSLAFSLQIFSRYAQYVPRVLWIFIGTIVYCAVAIPGYSHFEGVLENFLLIVAYWLAIYQGVSLPEHFIFRGGTKGYQPETYAEPRKLPPSVAALGAFCFGIFGAVMGMAQSWFTGPVGRSIGGEAGGDVGFELAFAFTLVSYVPFRWLERKYFGR